MSPTAQALSAHAVRRRIKRLLITPRLRRKLHKLQRDQGATTLEYVLLLAAIALPSYVIVQMGLATLFGHYRMITTINGLPFP
jgi:Flp pilus assembly pilin Flp